MSDTETVESLREQLAEAQRYIHKLRKELGPLREMGNPISEHEAQWQLRLQEANRSAAARGDRARVEARQSWDSNRSHMWRERVGKAFAELRRGLTPVLARDLKEGPAVYVVDAMISEAERTALGHPAPKSSR